MIVPRRIASLRRNLGLISLFFFLTITFMLLAISKSHLTPIPHPVSTNANHTHPLPPRQVHEQPHHQQSRRRLRHPHSPLRLLRRPRRAPHPRRELVHPPPRRRPQTYGLTLSYIIIYTRSPRGASSQCVAFPYQYYVLFLLPHTLLPPACFLLAVVLCFWLCMILCLSVCLSAWILYLPTTVST